MNQKAENAHAETPKPADKLVSTDQLVSMLSKELGIRITQSQILRWARDGKVPFVKIGNRRYFTVGAVRAAVDEMAMFRGRAVQLYDE